MSKNKTATEKRKIQQAQKKKTMQKMLGLSIGIIAIIGVVVVVALSMGNEEPIQKTQPVNTNTVENDDQIAISLSEIDNAASFFTYKSDGADITYFILEDTTGDIHAAFDACDVCYDAKKGYVKDGDEMKCLNCGLTFPIAEIGTSNNGGGCWPSYLPITIKDDNIIINKSDLESKKFMFE